MERFTKEKETGSGYTFDVSLYDFDIHEKTQKAINKLGELEDLESKLQMSLKKFIRCLQLLDVDNFKFVYWLDKKDGWYCETWSPIPCSIDMKKRMFVELRGPKSYGKKLKFKEYGKTWALIEDKEAFLTTRKSPKLKEE